MQYVDKLKELTKLKQNRTIKNAVNAKTTNLQTTQINVPKLSRSIELSYRDQNNSIF